jgi:uncharacterized repeat protein (TIGR01451 family)
MLEGVMALDGESSMKNSKRIVWLLLCTALWAGAQVRVFALNGELQGLNKRYSTNWTADSPWRSGPLRGWQELDMIPCRVKLPCVSTGFTSSVTIVFPHTTGKGPGFENLFFLSNSPNVTVIEAPALNAPTNTGEWSYDLKVSVRGSESAYIYFYARLAVGSYLNPGSSLHISGEPGLSPLQIHKPRLAPSKPNLAVRKAAPAVVFPGETITYMISYTNAASGQDDVAHGVKLKAILPALASYVPDSANSNGVMEGNVLSWNLPDLAKGSSGSVSYQVTVSTNAPGGESLTSTATIFSAENDLDPADNFSSVRTAVLETPRNDQPLRITRIEKTGDGHYNVYFTTTFGRYYALQHTEDFVNWTTDSTIIPGTGSVEVSMQSDIGAYRFFRVMQLP